MPKTEKDERKRKIYLIMTEDANGEQLYKIGFTKREVHKRIKEFRTGNSSDFHVLHIFEPEDFACTIERKLHLKFNDKHVKGEWFGLDSDDVKLFPELCTKYYEQCKYIQDSNSYMDEMGYRMK